MNISFFFPLFLLLSYLQVWELFYESDRVRDMLERLIKEESLRTYLFTYSHVYNSISMKTLSEMFELPKSTTHSIISKMIINEELMASLDDPTQTVVMHRSEPSRLQSLALQLADKVNNFVDSNERIFEMKQGKYKQFFFISYIIYTIFFRKLFSKRWKSKSRAISQAKLWSSRWWWTGLEQTTARKPYSLTFLKT